jgi:hypothetical protein
MKFFVLLSLVISLSTSSLYAGKIELPKVNEFCKSQNKPILSYAELFADQGGDGRSKEELYLDRYKGELKGLYMTENGPVTLVGQMTTKEDFILCGYDFRKGGEAKEIFKGRYLADGIEFQAAKGELKRIGFGGYFLPNRDYSIEHKANKHAYQIRGRTSDDEPDTCNYDEAYFALLGGKDKKVNGKINRLIEEIKERYSSTKTRTSDCLGKKDIPNGYNLSIGLMYAGPRLVSAKVDYVVVSKSDSNWDGETFNYDRQTNTHLYLEELLGDKNEKPLVDEIKKRMIKLYGTTGRFNSLMGVNFSFTTQTLVASFAPVDEKGFYMNTFRIDIPMPMSFSRKFLDSKLFPQ